VKGVDIVYTDVFLDVTNYRRDKQLFAKLVTGVNDQYGVVSSDSESDISDDSSIYRHGIRRTNMVVVCSTALYDYISGAERALGRELTSDKRLTRSGATDIYICDMSMETVPDHIDTLVTFNIDPFEECSKVGYSDNFSKFRRTFKRFVLADKREGDDRVPTTTVCMVFSMFLLNERALERFIAVNNVSIIPSDVRFVFVHDNMDTTAVRDIVCNYCTDLMLCLNSDMQPFVVDGEMPSSVDFALAANPLNLVILKTRPDALQVSPENEYFRFKQFYHTFAYGKQSKWGIDVEGSDDDDDDHPTADRTFYIHSLNDALQQELVRLFAVLRRTARHKFENELKRRGHRANELQPTLKETTDYEESDMMIEAREKLFRAYYSCPILMDTVDIRSIATLGNDGGKTLLKRDQRQLLTMLKHTDKNERDRDAALHSLTAQTKTYDTMTYPTGGNISDPNVLQVLLAEEIGVSSCFVVGKNQQIRYNRFLSDLLFPPIETP
jgi:hypothetical protein